MRFVTLLLLVHGATCALGAQQLADTKPLTIEGDIASQLVDGVDEFLLRELAESVKNREQHWNCLLYTSPSPRDQRGSRMPSSA